MNIYMVKDDFGHEPEFFATKELAKKYVLKEIEIYSDEPDYSEMIRELNEEDAVDGLYYIYDYEVITE